MITAMFVCMLFCLGGIALAIGAGVITACCIVALLCKGIIHIAGL